MKNSLKFNSSVCTSVEQSKRLLELGLKPETADMCIDLYHEDKPFVINEDVDLSKQTEFIPSWSLHRLIEMLPNEIPMEDYYLILGVSFNCVCYADNEYAEVFQSFDGNTYSCIIKCVEWLIKEDYFNKEYLK